MEQVLAALIGWIDTSAEIVNLNSGVRIERLLPEDIVDLRNDAKDDPDAPQIPADVTTVVVVTYASGQEGYYFDEDANAILDRAAKFAAIGELLTSNAENVAERIQAAMGTQT